MRSTYTVNGGTMTVTEAEALWIERSAAGLALRYDTASPETLAYGLDWYAGKGRALAERVAHETGITFHEAAAIVALCSPQTRWEWQEDFTAAMVRHLLRGGSVETAPRASLYRNNIAKAKYLLETGDYTIIRGPKITPFYANIIGNYDVVTVDVWAIRAVIGSKAKVDPYTTGRRHALMQAAYHRAAETVGVPVAQLQAVVWVQVRPAEAAQLTLELY